MQDKQTRPNDADAIREILSRADDRTVMGQMQERKNDDGSTEFIFEERVSGGLVFEEGAPQTAKGAKKPAAHVAKPTPREAAEEFSVPEQFTVNAKYNTPLQRGEEPRVYRTYVPVFTEASENYRMTGRTTLPQAEESPAGPVHKKETLQTPVIEVVATTAAEHKDVSDPEDPTAEGMLEAGIAADDDSVIVRVDTAKPAFDVFVPSTQPTQPPEPERTLEDEQDEIRRLLDPDTDRTAPEIIDCPSEEAEQGDGDAEEALDSTAAADVATNGGIFTPMRDKTAERPRIPDPEQTTVEEVVAAQQSTARRTHSPSRTKPSRKREAEYQMYSDSTKLKNRFLDGLFALRVRALVATLLTLLTLALGLAPVLGIDVRELLGLQQHKGVLALFDLQLCLCALALAIPEIIVACKQLFAKNALSTVVPLASTVCILAYDLYFIFAGITSYALFGALYALGMLSVILSAYFERRAMYEAFKLISVKGVKGALERVKTRTLEEENVALDGAIDEYKSYTARMFKTSFVSDFFRRHRPSDVQSGHTVFLLCLLGACSVLTGVIAFFLGDGIRDAIYTFAMTFLSSMSVASVLCRPLTYALAQRCTFAEDSAVLGERTMYEYADIDVVTFRDTDVFGHGDVALKRVLIYGDKSRLSGALRQMASLFTAIGGPLHMLFSDTLDRRPLPASRVKAEIDGVSGETEGAFVQAGNAAYMARLGYSIPDSAVQEQTGTTRVLYLAEGGVVYAKFIFRYSFSEEFSQLLPILREQGIVPLIYTRDPNLRDDLVLALTTGVDCMRVMHLHTLSTEEEAVPSGSAGMVTLGDKDSAISLILLAKTYTKHHGLMERVLLGQVVAGILLSASLSLLHVTFATLPWLLLWQLLWCAVAVVLGARKFSLRKKRKELLEKEKELSHE